MVKRLLSYFKKKWHLKLYLRIYFSHLNHPKSDPWDAIDYANRDYDSISEAIFKQKKEYEKRNKSKDLD